MVHKQENVLYFVSLALMSLLSGIIIAYNITSFCQSNFSESMSENVSGQSAVYKAHMVIKCLIQSMSYCLSLWFAFHGDCIQSTDRAGLVMLF